ncbi:hypothetical protein A6R68_11974, partial [Neotoma lepida]
VTHDNFSSLEELMNTSHAINATEKTITKDMPEPNGCCIHTASHLSIQNVSFMNLTFYLEEVYIYNDLKK